MRPETVELLTWISRAPRSYPEAIEVWRTNCPQHSVWEDALGEGLVEVVRNGGALEVRLTPEGADAVAARMGSGFSLTPAAISDECEAGAGRRHVLLS